MRVCHTEKSSQYNSLPQICQHVSPNNEEALLYHQSLILLRTFTMDMIILSDLNPYSTFSYYPYNIIYRYFFSVQDSDKNYSLHLIPIVMCLFNCLEQSLSPPHHSFLLVFHVINIFKEPRPTNFAEWPSVYIVRLLLQYEFQIMHFGQEYYLQNVVFFLVHHITGAMKPKCPADWESLSRCKDLESFCEVR